MHFYNYLDFIDNKHDLYSLYAFDPLKHMDNTFETNR